LKRQAKRLVDLDVQMAKLSFVKAELTIVDFHLYELNEELDELSSMKRTEKSLKMINQRAPIVYDLLQRMNELLIIHLYNFFEIKKDLNSLAKTNQKIKCIMKALNPIWKLYLQPIEEFVNKTRESVLAHGSIEKNKGYLGLNDIVKSQKKFYKDTVLASKVAQMYADAIISHRGGGKSVVLFLVLRYFPSAILCSLSISTHSFKFPTSSFNSSTAVFSSTSFTFSALRRASSEIVKSGTAFKNSAKNSSRVGLR